MSRSAAPTPESSTSNGVVCTFTFGGNGKCSESVNDDAMEAKNHGGVAYGGRKSQQRHIWRSEIAIAALHKVIGIAFALSILFHILVWAGVLITGCSTLLFLGLQRFGDACRYFLMESGFALVVAFLINVAAVSVSGTVCSADNLTAENVDHCSDLTLNSASFLLKVT
ncbi:hypothetical protein JHK84_045310 [Glycine max]|nr:hypothetical protein JHK84_045310 [Glycine max]